MKLNDMKIGAKLYGGFGIVLVLLAMVAYQGYSGLDQAALRAQNVADCGDLQADILQARAHQDAFVVTKDKKLVAEMREHTANARKLAQTLKSRFKVKADQDKMDELLRGMDTLDKGMDSYAAGEDELTASMTGMREKAHETIRVLGDLGEAVAGMALALMKETEETMEDRLKKNAAAQQLRNLVGEAKALRITLMFKEDAETLARWKETNKKIFDLTRDLKGRFVAEENIKLADAILESYTLYEKQLLQYLKTREEADKEQAVKAAAATVKDIEAIAVQLSQQIDEAWKKGAASTANQFKNSDNAADMVATFLDARKNEKEFIIYGTDEYVDKVKAAMAKIAGTADQLRERLAKPENRARVDAALKAVGEYDKLFTEYMVNFKKVNALDKETDKTAGDLARLSAEVSGDEKKKMEREMAASQRFMLLGALLAMGVGIAVAFLIARGISRPVAKGVEFAKRVAGLDLTSRLDVHQKDEIGDLAAAMNGMADTLTQIVRNIGGNVETLSSSSTEMAAIARQMSAGAETTAAKSAAVAAASEEMTSNMNSVAASMEQASSNMSTIAASTEEMTASIAEIAANAARAKESASGAVELSRKASVQVNELGAAAEEIGVVTETIKAISDKTNLLALNATIEAARAGEAGKGFAVVANEIKDLAQQTAAATGDISKKLKNIQKSSGLTVTEIEEVSTAIVKVDELVAAIAASVEEQNATTGGIAENVAQAGSGIQEINENVNQSSRASSQVAQEIAEVNAAAGEMSNSSAQVQQSAADLSQLAEQLKEVVGRFRV